MTGSRDCRNDISCNSYRQRFPLSPNIIRFIWITSKTIVVITDLVGACESHFLILPYEQVRGNHGSHQQANNDVWLGHSVIVHLCWCSNDEYAVDNWCQDAERHSDEVYRPFSHEEHFDCILFPFVEEEENSDADGQTQRYGKHEVVLPREQHVLCGCRRLCWTVS